VPTRIRLQHVPFADVTGSRSGGQMKQLQHQLVRFFAFTILAMAVACCLAYLLLLSGGDHPYLIACVAAAIGAALLAFAGRPRGEPGLHQFADTVGNAIDAIMIGAAETSYFVDSVKQRWNSMCARPVTSPTVLHKMP